MVNIMSAVVGVIFYLVITFVVNNFVLQKDFDIAQALVNLFAVLITLWIANKLSSRLGVKGKVPLS